MVKIETTKMSSKGQVVIPAEFRKDIKEGETLILIKGENHILLKKASALDRQFAEDLEFAKRTEEAWKEIESGKGKSYSVEEFLNRLKNG